MAALSTPRKEGYELRLSAINSTSTRVRHDYPIDDYRSREAAEAEAESFIEHTSQRLQEGVVSSADPEIGHLRRTIREFTGERPRAYFGLCCEPTSDQIVSEVSGELRNREGEIFDDADKIVPDRNLEKFISRTTRDVQTRIEEEARTVMELSSRCPLASRYSTR